MALLDSPEIVVDGPGLPSIDAFARARILRDEHGFIPASRAETNEAFSLLSFGKKGGGTARHLNEVLRHQAKARAKHIATAEALSASLKFEVLPLLDIDPEAAVMSITKKYVGFYRDAHNGTKNMMDLADKVADTDNPNLFLADEIPMRIGLGYVSRYVALKRQMNRSNQDREGILLLRPYEADYFGSVFKSPDPATVALVGDVTIGQARHLVPEAISDQLARFEFWGDRLHEARTHAVARSLAENALSLYGDL